MIIYILFFLAVFLFTILGNQVFGRNNIKVVIIPVFIMILFAGLRGNIGTDTFAYKSFFNALGSDKQNEFSLEPLFVFFTYFIKFIWSDDQFYIFSLSVVLGLLLYYNLKIVEEKSLFLLFYLTGFYVMFNLNLMRFGLGILLISYPYLISLRGGKSKMGLYFLGVMTHFSTLFSLSFVIQRKHILKIAAFQAAFFFLFGNFLLQKFGRYLFAALLNMGTFHLDFGFVFEIAVLFILYWINRKDLKKNILFLLLTYVLLRNFGLIFEMLQRFAYITGLLIYLNFFYKRQSFLTKSLLVTLIFFNLYRSLMFIYNSDQAINELIANFPGFSTLYSQTKWLPYKFFWQ